VCVCCSNFRLVENLIEQKCTPKVSQRTNGCNPRLVLSKTYDRSGLADVLTKGFVAELTVAGGLGCFMV
jgi:hypothetical protein